VAQVLLWRSAGLGLLFLPLVLTRPPRITRAMIIQRSLDAFLGMFLYFGSFAMGKGGACRPALSL
jgi:hypothetical protein